MSKQTENGGNTPLPQPPDQLSRTEKYIAGFLLIFFILAPAGFIIAHWPDRIPGSKDNLKPLYINEPFHVRLASVPDSFCCSDTFFIKSNAKEMGSPAVVDTTKKPAAANPVVKTGVSAKKDTVKQKDKGQVDTVGATGSGAGTNASGAGKGRKDSEAPVAVAGTKHYYLIKDLLDLNILVLALVAAGGFLGNMIYIATSLTTFIGADKFNRSWLLWYFVKPFTAAALAMGLYFVFRGGFLNYTADASGINLYGVLTIAILAGLFTDKATLKLKEIFDVVFTLKKDDRPNPLVHPTYKFNPATPAKLSKAEKNIITITGENFDKGTLSFKMNDVLLAPEQITKTATTITLSYTIPAAPADVPPFILVITDDQGKDVFKQSFSV